MPKIPDDLPDNDRALIEAARKGERWPLQADDDEETWSPHSITLASDNLANPDFVCGMPAIQATTIRALCLGAWDNLNVDPKGLYLSEVRIEGILDLSFVMSFIPLRLLRCNVAKRMVLFQADFPLIYLSGSRLEGGIRADRLRVRGSLQCRKGFTSVKPVRLLGANIGEDLSFRNGRVFRDGEDRNRSALLASRAVVTGRVTFDNGFRAKGPIRLDGAKIGGNLTFAGAHLDGDGSECLTVRRSIVEGNVICRNIFSERGDSIFIGTRINGQFDWRPIHWDGELSMAHARVGQWRDNWRGTSWDCSGSPSLDLTDFAYDSFYADDEVLNDATSRIHWVQHSLADGFMPGPYEVLATTLRKAGDEDGAKTVALEKHRHQTRYRSRRDVTPWMVFRLGKSLVGFVLDWTIGYGYRPWRGVGLLAAAFLLGTAFFAMGGPTANGGPGVIKPAVPVTIMQDLNRRSPCTTPDGKDCGKRLPDTGAIARHDFRYDLPPEYTPFHPAWYSLDTLVPLVDLGQEKSWSPSPIGNTWRDDPAGWSLLYYLYAHILAGWILTTLTVVALTGLIKKE